MGEGSWFLVCGSWERAAHAVAAMVRGVCVKPPNRAHGICIPNLATLWVAARNQEPGTPLVLLVHSRSFHAKKGTPTWTWKR